MKAVVATSHGAPDVLVLTDVPTPTPGPGQILVKVESAGVNFSDVMRRRNDIYPFPTSFPFIPGGEVAGTVERLGEGVQGPPVGTDVFALVGGDGSTGYAQYALAGAQQVIPTPPTLGPDQAAGIVVAGVSALLMLTEVGQLKSGETVLIEGVGGYAVQIAKLLGARVIGAASTSARRDAALAAGADDVVDYSRTDWPDTVRALTAGAGVDVVLHISGGVTFAGGLEVLAPFGRLVVGGRAGGTALTLTETQIRTFFYDPSLNQSLRVFNVGLYFGLRPEISVQALQTLIGYVASGQVKVGIGQILPLGEAAEAHRLLEGRQSTGKIVLKPWAAA